MSREESKKLFVRETSGLVRTLNGRDIFLMNFMYLAPAASIAYPLTFAFFFPGSNWILATIIGALLALPTAMMYYYISRLTPKTAADYIYVSRYLGPRVGLIQALVNLFGYGIGIDVQTEMSLVIVPFFQALGVAFHNQGLINLGNELISNTTYYFAFTTLMILLVGLVMIFSIKWVARVISSLTILQIVGTIAIIILLAYIGRGGFISSFNSLSSAFKGPSYSDLTSFSIPSFSFFDTLMLGIMIMGNLFIYNNAPVWVGGEVKKGYKTIRAGILYSYVTAAIISVILVYVIIADIGQRFFLYTSVNGWTTSSGSGIPIAPYSLLAYVIIPAIHNIPLLLLLLISGLTWYISYALIGAVAGIRAMFAASFDRMLPEKFADVSVRLKSPYVSTLVFIAIALVFNYLEIYQGFSLSLMFGVISYMLFQYFIASLGALKLSKKEKNEITSKLLVTSILSIVAVGSAIGLMLGYGILTYTPNGFGYDLFSGNIIPSVALLIGIIVAAEVWYEIVKWYRMKKDGIDIKMIFSEIPPD